MKYLCGGIAGLMLATAAMAQIAPPRLSIPDAGQALPRPAVQPMPGAKLPPAPAAALPDSGPLRFSHVRVTGAVRVPAARIAAQFAPLLNRRVSARDLAPVLDRINALYKEAGLPLGRAVIPAQHIKNGTLTVRVVEGYVAKLAVQGGDAALRELIEKMARPLLREHPLTRAGLERVMLLLGSLPGVTLQSRFTAMDPLTGGVTLALDATVRPVTVGLSLDNRTNLGSLAVLPFVTVTLNGLTGPGDAVALTALLSPQQKDDAFYSVAATRLLDADGLSAGLEASWAQLLDQVSLRPFQVRSRTTQLAAKLRDAAIVAADESLALAARVYYSRAAYSLVSLPGTLAQDQYVAAELGGDYARALSGDLGLAAALRLTQGLASLSGEPHTRLNTRPNFTKARMQVRLAWQPRTDVTVTLDTMGQYSPDSLPAAEEIAFGGLNHGRAFSPAEISGDSGLGATFQPEYRIALAGAWSLSPFLTADYARAFNRRRDLQPDGELVSAGGGVKVGLGGYAEVTLEMDKPLNRTPLDRGDRSWRFFAGAELGLDQALRLIGQSR